MSHDHEPPRAADPTSAPTGPVEPELLSAYFDGELEAGEAARVEAAVRGDARVRDQLEDLRLMSGITRGVLEREAAAVPQARFEQIWDQIDRALDREEANRVAPPSAWSRILAGLRAQRWTLAGVGVAAAAVVLVVAWPRGQGVNPTAPGASVGGPAVAEAPKKAPVEPAEPPTEPPPTMHAQAPPLPAAPPAPPMANDAKVEVVEFGGKAGRIGRIEGQHGTTTVIWVTEEEPIDSERSL